MLLQYPRISTAPLRAEIAGLRLPTEPTNTQTILRLKALQRANKRNVFLDVIGETPTRRPIHRLMVARDAPDRVNLNGANVTLHSEHAAENGAFSVPPVAKFLASHIKENHPYFSTDEFAYVAYLSTDVDGYAMNTQHGQKFTPLGFLDGRVRGVGLRLCTNYEMPYPPTQRLANSRRETELVADLLHKFHLDSLTSIHRAAWGDSGVWSNMTDDYGMNAVLSSVLGSYGDVEDFDPDFPDLISLAPGVFTQPAVKSLQALGLTTMAELLEILRTDTRFFLFDFPIATVRHYDDTEQRRVDAMHAGTQRLFRLTQPFLEKIAALPLDASLRQHAIVRDWLKSIEDAPCPEVGHFIPSNRDPFGRATPKEAFRLTDFRVWLEVGRLADAAKAAAMVEEYELAGQIWTAVAEEVEALEATRGFVEPPPKRVMGAAAEFELAAACGHPFWGCLDFGPAIQATTSETTRRLQREQPALEPSLILSHEWFSPGPAAM